MLNRRWIPFLVTAIAPFAACVGGESGASNAGGLDASTADTTVSLFDASDVSADASIAIDAAACAVQPSLSALGEDAGGIVIADDFTCADGIDLDASMAELDFAATGFARARQARVLESPGDGGEGRFGAGSGTPTDGGIAIEPGRHAFASVDFVQSTLVNGDLELDVAGPFTLESSAALNVNGNLKIVASGPVAICGIAYVAGDVTIEQPTDVGVSIGCPGSSYGGIYAGFADTFNVKISAGNLEVDTLGALNIPGFVYTGAFGSDSQAKSGDITLRAYGDVTLGAMPDASAQRGGTLQVGSPCAQPTQDAGACDQGTNGVLRIFSEGAIVFNRASNASAGAEQQGATGGDVLLHGLTGVTLTPISYASAGHAGSLEIRSQGDVLLDNARASSGRSSDASTSVDVRARNITLRGGSSLYAAGNGGSAKLAAASDILLDTSSYVSSADATCRPAGNVTLSAEGNIAIIDNAYLAAGNQNVVQGCTPPSGGNITLTARGTINATEIDGGPALLTAGAGYPVGVVKQTPGASIVIGPLDVALEPSVVVVSKPRPTASDGVLFTGLGATDPPSFFGAHVLVSPDGTSEFLPLRDLGGKPLAAGWRWQLVMQPRMFDPSAVDGVVLRVR